MLCGISGCFGLSGAQLAGPLHRRELRRKAFKGLYKGPLKVFKLFFKLPKVRVEAFIFAPVTGHSMEALLAVLHRGEMAPSEFSLLQHFHAISIKCAVFGLPRAMGTYCCDDTHPIAISRVSAFVAGHEIGERAKCRLVARPGYWEIGSPHTSILSNI